MKAHICGKPLEAAETGQIEQSGEQSLKDIISRLFPGCNQEKGVKLRYATGKQPHPFSFEQKCRQFSLLEERAAFLLCADCT